jgi:hypothetical protein
MVRVRRRLAGGLLSDALTAGLAGAACSAIPSTAWSLVRGEDVREGGRAAGAMLLPHDRRATVLLAAAVPVHLAISIPLGDGHGRHSAARSRARLVSLRWDGDRGARPDVDRPADPLHPDAPARPPMGGPRGIRSDRRAGPACATVPSWRRTGTCGRRAAGLSRVRPGTVPDSLRCAGAFHLRRRSRRSLGGRTHVPPCAGGELIARRNAAAAERLARTCRQRNRARPPPG